MLSTHHLSLTPLTLPSWITACAGAHVSRGRAQLQKGSPLEAQASCLAGVGSPGQSSPVTCFPFLSLYLFGRKAHWPQCRTLNLVWWGRRAGGSSLWEWSHLSSCVYSVGNQCVILKVGCVSCCLVNNLCYLKGKWVYALHITSSLHEWLPGWPINRSGKILWVYFHLVTSLGPSAIWTTKPTIALDCSKKKMLICLPFSDILGFSFCKTSVNVIEVLLKCLSYSCEFYHSRIQ